MNENRKLCITAGGGLGDQICAEPVIRYMKNSFFKDDDIVIMTQFPDIFKHLDVTCYDYPLTFKEQHITISTHPTNEEQETISFQTIHPVDYISLRLLRKTLPLADKRINLIFPEDKLQRILQLIGDYSQVVILHPGITWQSKTIPLDIWQSYADILQKNNYKVVVIGKNLKVGALLDQDRSAFNLKDMSLGQPLINLIDKIDTQELFALLSIAPCLISNDSGPIHIAGAFNNWVGVIATAKHPDYLYPFRYNTQMYKVEALEEYQIYKDFEYDPFKFLYYPNALVDEKRLRLAAPAQEKVLKFVNRVFCSRKENIC